jgi:hypothetical protein
LKIRIFTVIALAAVLALPGSIGRAASEGVLAIVWHGYDASLQRLAPASLEPLDGHRLALGRQNSGIGRSAYTWTFSPDGAQVAVGGRLLCGLCIADVRTMRMRGRMSTWEEPLAWLAPRRLLAGEQTDYNYAPNRLALIDPVKRRVLKRQRLGGSIVRADSVDGRLILLLAPNARIGSARIAVADAGGRIRTAALTRIQAGIAVDEASHSGRFEYPALAVDPASGRAFVVGSAPVVAEVDLRTLAVRYHELGLATLKLAAGSMETAAWLGNGLLALAGTDARVFTDRSGNEQEVTAPSGLRFVDTGTWTVRTIDPGAAYFTVADGLVLAFGSSWNSETDVRTGMGVAGYTRAGDLRLHVFGEDPVASVQAAGGYAYVTVIPSVGPAVFELASGRVLGLLERPMPYLLVPGQSPY